MTSYVRILDARTGLLECRTCGAQWHMRDRHDRSRAAVCLRCLREEVRT